MKLKEILAISGTSGLHKYVAQGRGGIIVESLADKKRTLVNGAAKVSALGDIAVFTDTQEVPLADLFTTIYKTNKGPVAITNKSSDKELVEFFTTALPNYDRDRVHLSDIKKIASWYNTLINAGMTDFSDTEEETSADEPTSETAATKKAAAKKTASAKTAAPKASPKASGAKVKATKSTNIRKSQ